MAVPESKKRVLAALAREPMDRVPIDYSGNPDITDRLTKYYGASDYESLLKALGVDIRIMMPANSYLFSPSHMLQDNMPTQNAVAMYRYVIEHGFYKQPSLRQCV